MNAFRQLKGRLGRGFDRIFDPRIERPELSQWRQWTIVDYFAYFLREEAMRRRLLGEPAPAALLSADEFREFCGPIRECLDRKFGATSPRVSIVIPAYNEEVELLPTIVSLSCLIVPEGGAEIVIA